MAGPEPDRDELPLRELRGRPVDWAGGAALGIILGLLLCPSNVLDGPEGAVILAVLLGGAAGLSLAGVRRARGEGLWLAWIAFVVVSLLLAIMVLALGVWRWDDVRHYWQF